MDNNQLYHHGVKGMRWGVRRYQNPDGTLTAAGRKRQERLEQKKPHEDYANAHSKKSVQQMSTKELQARNTRLQAEQQYANLTKKTSVGKKVVTAFIATAGTLTAVGVAVDQYKKFAKRDDVQKVTNKVLSKLGGEAIDVLRISPDKVKGKAAAVAAAYYIAKGSKSIGT